MHELAWKSLDPQGKHVKSITAAAQMPAAGTSHLANSRMVALTAFSANIPSQGTGLQYTEVRRCNEKYYRSVYHVGLQMEAVTL